MFHKPNYNNLTYIRNNMHTIHKHNILNAINCKDKFSVIICTLCDILDFTVHYLI